MPEDQPAAMTTAPALATPQPLAPNASGEPGKPAKPKKKEDSFPVFLVKLALVVAIFRSFFFSPFNIPSESMLPRLWNGDYFIAAKWPYGYSRWSLPFSLPLFPGQVLSSPPERGDVVVFKHPVDKVDYIKRVVGLPGDRLKVLDGRAYINGELQDEPFIKPDSSCISCDLEKEITIPADQFFMMGDNRGGSADSRIWGPVPKDQIVGTAFFTYWPPGRVGIL